MNIDSNGMQVRPNLEIDSCIVSRLQSPALGRPWVGRQESWGAAELVAAVSGGFDVVVGGMDVGVLR